MDRLPGLLRAPAVAVAAAAAGVLLLAGQAEAGTVTISDTSHALTGSDRGAVTAAASELGQDPVRIYSTTGLANDDAAFDAHFAEKMESVSPQTVIIGVNTKSRHVTIHSGKKSGFHAKDARAAAEAFTGVMRSGRGYADAIVAMLRSLQTSLTGHPVTTSTATRSATTPAGSATAATGTTATTTGTTGAKETSRVGLIAGIIGVIAVIAIGGVLLVRRGSRRTF